MMQKIFSTITGATGIAVNAIISKWYFVVAIPAMSITYIVLKELGKKGGVFELILAEIKKDLDMLERIAVQCTPKILNIYEFMQCLEY